MTSPCAPKKKKKKKNQPQSNSMNLLLTIPKPVGKRDHQIQQIYELLRDHEWNMCLRVRYIYLWEHDVPQYYWCCLNCCGDQYQGGTVGELLHVNLSVKNSFSWLRGTYQGILPEYSETSSLVTFTHSPINTLSRSVLVYSECIIPKGWLSIHKNSVVAWDVWR